MIELTVLGNVGGTRLHQSDKSTVLTISIASNRKTTDGKVFTDWATAKVWGERAIALEQHIRQGQKLLVRGRPEVSAYLRSNGQAAADLVLHARDLEFVGPKPVPAEAPKAKKRKAQSRRDTTPPLMGH